MYELENIRKEFIKIRMMNLSVNFCMKCGSQMGLREIDGVERKACSSCEFVYWGDYSIGVGGLVIRENKILLVKRAHDPGKGYWTNPGGYIEQFENIEETIQREVKEEAGITARVNRIVALRDLPRHIHNVYIAFTMDYINGEPVPDGIESDEAGFYTLEEIEQMNVAPFTRWLVKIAFESNENGLQKDEITVLKDSFLFSV